MPSFKYTALNNKGTKIKGNYTASTASDVAEMLKHKNISLLKYLKTRDIRILKGFFLS